MARHRIPLAFALVAVAACASRPNPPPPEMPAPVQSPTATSAPTPNTEAPALTPASGRTEAATATPPSTSVAPDPNDPTTPLASASESESTPGVQPGAIAVLGQLHPTRVHAGMRTAFPAIRECHKKALEAGTAEDKPTRVQLNFEITESGTVNKLTDDTANLNPLFSSCVLRTVLAVKFQPPKRGTAQVNYPLELTKP